MGFKVALNILSLFDFLLSLFLSVICDSLSLFFLSLSPLSLFFLPFLSSLFLGRTTDSGSEPGPEIPIRGLPVNMSRTGVTHAPSFADSGSPVKSYLQMRDPLAQKKYRSVKKYTNYLVVLGRAGVGQGKLV